MRGSIQRMAIIFFWIQALLGQFPMWNTAPKVRIIAR
jgi:hypothetical protein